MNVNRKRGMIMKIGRIENEKRVIKLMIVIYCRKKHKVRDKDGMCEECRELLEYAHFRLSKCPFGNSKSTCGKCKIHCYKPEMRTKVKEVMKFSGPRLIIYNPFELIKHVFY